MIDGPETGLGSMWGGQAWRQWVFRPSLSPLTLGIEHPVPQGTGLGWLG